MNLTQLRAFDAVARTGSVSRAARLLGVTPAAVSVHVRQLERACDVVLIERVRRRPRLSAAGRALHEYSRRIFALAEEARLTVELMRDLRAGALRLGGTDTPARAWLPPLLAEFRHRYPGVRVELTVGNTRDILARLAARDDDVAVIAGVTQDPAIVAERLTDDPLVVVAPPAHHWPRRRRVTLRELAAEPLIVRETGSSTRQVLDAAFAKAVLEPRVVMELGSHDAIVGAVEHGAGVSVLPSALVQREVDRGTVRAHRLRDVRLAHPVCVAFLAERAEFPLTRGFLEIARRLPRRTRDGRATQGQRARARGRA